VIGGDSRNTYVHKNIFVKDYEKIGKNKTFLREISIPRLFESRRI